MEGRAQSNAQTYQSMLDNQLIKITEVQSKMGDQGEALQQDLINLNQSLQHTEQRFTESEKQLQSMASSYHDILDIRLTQLTADVQRFKADEIDP